MTAGLGRRHGAGLSLVELLVIVAIVSVLIAALVTVAAQTREAARDVNCRSNLRQLQAGWLVFITRGDGKIPYTKHYYRRDRTDWIQALDSVYEHTPSVFGTGDRSYGACPTIDVYYKPMLYVNGRYGYAINVLWVAEGTTVLEYNEFKRWSEIARPSDYPWFVDPTVFPFGSGYSGANYVPYAPKGGPDWGLGWHHGRADRANCSFADGSARPVNRHDVVRGDARVFSFFENR